MNLRIEAWLHRRCYARLLNCSSNNFDHHGTAYVEAVGPLPVGLWLARYVVRNSELTRANWATIRVTKTEQVSRWRRRWQFRYERISR